MTYNKAYGLHMDMKSLAGPIGMLCLVIGVAVAIIGTLDYTGFIDLGLPSIVAFVGYALIIAGAIAVWIDISLSGAIIEDAYCRSILKDVPNDDYLVDLTGSETAAEGPDDPTIMDISASDDMYQTEETSEVVSDERS